jgi:hypothetical protein
MALTDYKEQFDNTYEEVFPKVIVSKEVGNSRFEPTLSYGGSIRRVAYDISNVVVRDTVRGSASTIDTITDTPESLTVNIEKEAVFYISDGEVTQTGPLNPGEVIGGQVAIKVAISLDALFFAEVRNALYAFDTGDLTTTTSNGTPIVLSSTTVPQMVSRMGAKLKRKNNQQVTTNMCLVVDAYAASDVTQYLLGKNIDLAGYTFKNGYTGEVSNATLYTSENLQGEATLTSTGAFTDTQTITIGGVVFTTVTTIGSTAGNVLIGANAAATIVNLAALINTPGTTTAQGVALSAADQNTIKYTLGLVATATSATVLTIVGTGSGRLELSETQTNASWSKNMIHAYFGKRGAIDIVIQDMKKVDMRPTADRRGTNVFSSLLAGIKTFADGAKKFLDVKIDAN